MFFRRFFAMSIVLLYLVPFTSAQDTATVDDNIVRLVYFLPSDRTAQSDIDTKIETFVKTAQTVYANRMDSLGYGAKTFTFETDDNGDAVVHHITGEQTDAYYNTADKWEIWDEIKEDGFDPSGHIYVAFVDLSSQEIDGWCGTGGDWTDANGGVVTFTASGNCFEGDYGTHILVHELGHAFGLRHDFRPGTTIDYATGQDPMVTSDCAIEWIGGHRYFNDYTTTSTESTTIEMATPSISGSDVTLTFTITDADGLHQAHFFTFVWATGGYDDLSMLDCRSVYGTTITAEFTTRALTPTDDVLTVRVMDDTGSMTEKQFSVDLSAIADVNGDGTVDIRDLVGIANNFGSSSVGDINGDGVVNVLDLILAANAIGDDAEAPSVRIGELEEPLTKANLQKWLHEARQVNLKDPAFQRGILVLEQLLARLTPTQTMLLPNYPNPFNPETWIPYQLNDATDVTITIYDVVGSVVRSLDLGHQAAGYYHSRSEAAYWDGRNALNERVASGMYFYQIQAGEFSATRRMLILK